MHIPPSRPSSNSLVTMSHGNPFGNAAQSHGSSACTQQSPEFQAIQKLIRHILRNPKISVTHLERLSSPLHRLFLVDSTEQRRYVLKCSPHYHVRLLRHELRNLETEARVLELVTSNTTVPVPQCIKQSSSGSSRLGSPYLLRTYLQGTPLADLIPYFSTTDRANIDRQMGIHFRAISALRSATFGSTHRVFSGSGFQTWRESFQALVEAALRDAEDMLVSIPYDTIRYHISIHQNLLDQITEPRMVLLDAGDPNSVLVDERTKQVVGLLGFSNVIWGDPMMGRIFIANSGPSEAFWDGWGGRVNTGQAGRIRQLLYTVYKAVLVIVTHHYRPFQETAELEARRTLTWALEQLDSAK